MKNNIRLELAVVFLFSATLFSCTIEPPYTGEYGIEYRTPQLYSVFDMDCLTDIRVEVTAAQWNKLLTSFDRDRYSEEAILCSVTFVQGDKTIQVDSAGIRLRGNTSRTRPEGYKGRMHKKDNTDWHHSHFLLNAGKFVKGQTFNGVQKLALKFFNEDPTYVREIYGYDLFKRFGVWTAINDTYCTLTLRVAEDSKDTYYGVYGMCETIDKDYLRARSKQFGDSEGNLWKCYLGGGMEKGTSRSDMGLETNNENRKLYELKTNTSDLKGAQDQFLEFIKELNSKTGDEFKEWIDNKTDVELLLKTFAVTYVIGHWDDYWGNANNYYVYFNSEGKFFMIPYDLDNILGTSLWTGDAGTLAYNRWGSSKRVLYSKLLNIEEYREKCIDYIYQLGEENGGLFDYASSMSRISLWHSMIEDYIENDTEENNFIDDYPAGWGITSNYKVFTPGSDNFFIVKKNHFPKR